MSFTVTNSIANDSSHEPLIEFVAFSSLPPELRQMIWIFTLQPRIVEVRLHEDDGFYSRSTIPPALKICKESRRAVNYHYPLCFGSAWYSARTRSNLSLDTLYFPGEMVENARLFFASLRDFELQNIQAVAVDDIIEDWENHHHHLSHCVISGIYNALEAMPNLSKIINVVTVGKYQTHLEIHELHCGPDGGATPIYFFNDAPNHLYEPMIETCVHCMGWMEILGDYINSRNEPKGASASKLGLPQTLLGVRRQLGTPFMQRNSIVINDSGASESASSSQKFEFMASSSVQSESTSESPPEQSSEPSPGVWRIIRRIPRLEQTCGTDEVRRWWEAWSAFYEGYAITTEHPGGGKDEREHTLAMTSYINISTKLKSWEFPIFTRA